MPRFLVVFAIFAVMSAFAVDLKPDAVAAFSDFIASAESRLESRFGGVKFLWTDEVQAYGSSFSTAPW